MEHYEAYRDSGVEWLGEIPVGWEVKRFRYVFDLITDKAGDNLLKIGLENIESGSGKFVATDNEFEGDGIHFLSGDILFGKLRPYLTKVYLADFPGKAVGDFFVFRSKGEIKEQFGAKLISSKRFIDITNSSTYGSKMPRVSWDFISELLIAYPNLEEQTAIANFLDRKTAEIDALIAQKEHLLELYEEEKTAIINHAVTKGIDPNAELKDSGIDWLGEIPVGWKVKKLKYLLKKNKGAIKTGPFGSQIKNSELTPSGEFKVYTQRNVLDEDFIKGDDRIDYEKFNTLKEFEIKPNDILFTTRGTIGRCAIFPSDTERGVLHPCLIRIQIAEELVLLEWIISYVNNSSFFIENVTLESNSTIIDVIYGGTLKEVVIPIPPKEEQASIISFLDYSMTDLDAKIAKTQRIIELQKEYRTALISEAVTGKIKVPELPTQEASA